MKPCPFCKSTNVKVEMIFYDSSNVLDHGSVECCDCEAEGPIVESNDYEEINSKAIELWNNREKGEGENE